MTSVAMTSTKWVHRRCSSRGRCRQLKGVGILWGVLLDDLHKGLVDLQNIPLLLGGQVASLIHGGGLVEVSLLEGLLVAGVKAVGVDRNGLADLLRQDGTEQRVVDDGLD